MRNHTPLLFAHTGHIDLIRGLRDLGTSKRDELNFIKKVDRYFAKSEEAKIDPYYEFFYAFANIEDVNQSCGQIGRLTKKASRRSSLRPYHRTMLKFQCCVLEVRETMCAIAQETLNWQTMHKQAVRSLYSNLHAISKYRIIAMQLSFYKYITHFDDEIIEEFIPDNIGDQVLAYLNSVDLSDDHSLSTHHDIMMHPLVPVYTVYLYKVFSLAGIKSQDTFSREAIIQTVLYRKVTATLVQNIIYIRSLYDTYISKDCPHWDNAQIFLSNFYVYLTSAAILREVLQGEPDPIALTTHRGYDQNGDNLPLHFSVIREYLNHIRYRYTQRLTKIFILNDPYIADTIKLMVSGLIDEIIEYLFDIVIRVEEVDVFLQCLMLIGHPTLLEILPEDNVNILRALISHHLPGIFDRAEKVVPESLVDLAERLDFFGNKAEDDCNRLMLSLDESIAMTGLDPAERSFYEETYDKIVEGRRTLNDSAAPSESQPRQSLKALFLEAAGCATVEAFKEKLLRHNLAIVHGDDYGALMPMAEKFAAALLAAYRKLDFACEYRHLPEKLCRRYANDFKGVLRLKQSERDVFLTILKHYTLSDDRVVRASLIELLDQEDLEALMLQHRLSDIKSVPVRLRCSIFDSIRTPDEQLASDTAACASHS